jgi:hypothetical protein
MTTSISSQGLLKFNRLRDVKFLLRTNLQRVIEKEVVK